MVKWLCAQRKCRVDQVEAKLKVSQRTSETRYVDSVGNGVLGGDNCIFRRSIPLLSYRKGKEPLSGFEGCGAR